MEFPRFVERSLAMVGAERAWDEIFSARDARPPSKCRQMQKSTSAVVCISAEDLHFHRLQAKLGRAKPGVETGKSQTKCTSTSRAGHPTGRGAWPARLHPASPGCVRSLPLAPSATTAGVRTRSREMTRAAARDRAQRRTLPSACSASSWPAATATGAGRSTLPRLERWRRRRAVAGKNRRPCRVCSRSRRSSNE